MNRIALAIVLGLSLLSPVYAAEETPPLRDVVDHVSPSVVGVIVELSEPAEPSKDQNQGSQVKTRDGTGMVFSSEGHIVTAVHVIEKAAKITVVFANNSRSMAQVGERTQRHPPSLYLLQCTSRHHNGSRAQLRARRQREVREGICRAEWNRVYPGHGRAHWRAHTNSRSASRSLRSIPIR